MVRQRKPVQDKLDETEVVTGVNGGPDRRRRAPPTSRLLPGGEGDPSSQEEVGEGEVGGGADFLLGLAPSQWPH